ncbi:hypothetical protein E18064_360288 [Elizabethkingia anophelis]|nr:hypothetical protein E18064_360288 [Elizabethkingia anophelis]
MYEILYERKTTYVQSGFYHFSIQYEGHARTSGGIIFICYLIHNCNTRVGERK